MSLPSRNLRVVKSERHRDTTGQLSPTALAPDSLAWSLLQAARVLAAVDAGQSLNQAIALLGEESPATRASAQDIVYGVLREYRRGEFVLGRLLSKPLTHPETAALLRAAIYRLDTRPDAAHTVVDQAVRAAAELAGGGFRGLVNAVLRNYLRQRDALTAAIAGDEEAHWQHPRWWLERLRRRWPQRWESIVAAGNTPPPMTLRVNCRRGAVADYLARLESAGIAGCATGTQGIRLCRPLPVDALPGFHDGVVSVQDAGAQRAAEILAPADGMRVLDACAAPGGKTAHLLESSDLRMLALDLDPTRVSRIEENLRRLRLSATVLVGDASHPEDWWDGQPFDAILADVPCSASGVVRRHPDIKRLRRESDVRRFAKTQAALLESLWPLLKPGGRLLYATCSVFVEENQGQIDAFLARHLDAGRVTEEEWLPCEENDGFYYALLARTG